ncbi:MAG: family 20 glycosylhydrolase [Armatimonadota bacterium]
MHSLYRGPENILPVPVSLELRSGRMMLTPQGRLVADEALMPLAAICARDLWTCTGKSVRLGAAQEAVQPGDILLTIDPSLEAEQYVMEVGEHAEVRGGSYEAVCRGTASLAQSVVRRHADRYLPYCRVEDAPYAGFRALMVDVAREPHTLATLKQLVVLCWFYKIRYLQLHLTDAEGFTFPSTRYPRLATRHNRLSLDDWRALEAFAVARGVTIIPELDVPGHVGESLKRLCPTHPHTGRAVINPVSARTFEVLDTLVGEMCEVFRATPYFHIGADEVVYDGWSNCRDCAREMKRHGLSDIHELYRCFIVRMNNIVKAHGKRTIVWEGFAKDGVTPIPSDIIVQFFDVFYLQPEEAMALGHDIVNACWGPLYVAGPHTTCPVEMIYQWHPALFGSFGLFNVPDALDNAPALGETTEPFHFFEKPFPGNYFPRAKAIPENREQMLGSMMASWGMRDEAEMPYLRRRVAAMSERIWHPRAGRSYADFTRRLDAQDDRLQGLLEDTLQADRDAAPGLLDYVRTLRVSDVQPPVRLRDLAYPADTSLTRRTFEGSFCDVSTELSTAKEGLIYYACNLHCDDAMRITAHLGYDGPVKLWVDGQPTFLDLHGSNPAIPGKAQIPLTLDAGTHEFRIALDANHGCACGIFLRFQRTDRPDMLPVIVG